MSSKALPDDQPLFSPDMVGLPAESWDDLDDDQAPATRRCAGSGCGRPLRSTASIEAGIGPCCAAKIGRAVIAGRRLTPTTREATPMTTSITRPTPGDPIDILDLSARPYNILKRGQVRTIGDLTASTETDITDLRNSGTRTLEEIKTKLAAHGLTLRTTEPAQRS